MRTRWTSRGHPSPTSLLVLAVAVAVGAAARRYRAQRMIRLRTGRRPGVTADDGVLLHVEVGGPADAPLTVVLAHGFAARLQEWQEQVGVLQEHARVVRYDQRGHGASGWSGRRSATIDQLGRDLYAVIAACADGPVVVVGHSMGGMAVLALARQRPELFGTTIVGAVLISTSAADLDRAMLPGAVGRTALGSRLADLAVRAVWEIAPLVDRLAPFGTPLGRALVRRWLFGRHVPPWALSRMQRIVVDTSDSAAAAFIPAVMWHDEQAALTVLARVPVHVVTGTDDRTIPAGHSARIARSVGDHARLMEVPGAGHMVNVTHAADVNRAIAEVIGRALPTGHGRWAGRAHGTA